MIPLRRATGPRGSAQSREPWIAVPFFLTRPSTDVFLLFVSLPLWWALGVEQFIWLPVLLWSAVKAIRRGRVRVPPALKLYAVLLFADIASSLFIVENYRYVSFIRTFAVFASGFLLIFVVVNDVRTSREVRRLLVGLVWMMAFAGLLGAVAVLGIYRPHFHSLIGTVLPHGIQSTGLGQRIVVRTAGGDGWFRAVGHFYRINSMFLFATLYASALAMSIPVVLGLASQSRRVVRWALIVISVLLIYNLVFTTGRSATLSLVLSGAVLVLVVLRSAHRGRLWLVVAICAAVLVLVGIIADPIGGHVLRLVVSGRGSSTHDRLFIYQKTVAGFLERPVLGWGTVRDIPGFPYPAGSHSQYLGILYRQGAVGLALWLLLCYSVVKRAWLGVRLKRPFAVFLAWGLVAALLNSVTEVLDLDAVTFMVFCLLVALVHVRDSEG